VGDAIECNDGNPCTDDFCNPATGICQTSNNTNACDDKNACTSGDTCSGGSCSGPLVDCNDNNDCTQDSCNPTSGCLNEALSGTDCDDGDLCTEADSCLAGSCSGSAKLCTDGDICTDDSCDGSNGDCVFPFNTASCDDEDACTSSDQCSEGSCEGSAINCNDGNQCTADSCESATGCINDAEALDNQPCDDNDACTENDLCDGGSVSCEGDTVDCDDGDICTEDSCDSATGCLNAEIEGCCTVNEDCDDNSLCTFEFCNTGLNTCVTFSNPCVDGNPCTNDTCDPSTGACSFPNNNEACNDNNNCTDNDSCSEGACSGVLKECDDGNICTDDQCNLGSGNCQQAPNNSGCNDDNACTVGDLCTEGECSGFELTCDDNNLCTNDLCDASSGECIFTPNSAPCDDDDLCTENDFCLGGGCTGEPIDCDDGQVCTLDFCAGNECIHTASNVEEGCCETTEDCDDGDNCTQNVCNFNATSGGECVFIPETPLEGVEEICGDGLDNDCNPETVCYELFTNGEDRGLITPIEGTQDAEDFYAWGPGTSWSSDTGYELEEGMVFLLYKDPNGDVSLMVTLDVVNTKETQAIPPSNSEEEGGAANLLMQGTENMSYAVKDDSTGDTFPLLTGGSAEVQWTWGACCGDGLVMESLNQEFELRFNRTFSQNLPYTRIITSPSQSVDIELSDVIEIRGTQ
tara:strand:- start:752 stop:2821 length:2070 start_codon:yes stop_codon:yes gene_type:complete